MDLNELEAELNRLSDDPAYVDWRAEKIVSVTSLDGELEQRVSRASGYGDPDYYSNFTLVEKNRRDGYSEYTNWTIYEFEIRNNNEYVWSSIPGEDRDNGLNQLLEWLDANAPVERPDEPRWGE